MFKFETEKFGEITVNFEYGKDYVNHPVVTYAKALDSNEEVITETEAICHENDHFQRSVGRKLALTRLLKYLGVTKEERVAAWEAYFTRVKKK